MIFATCYMGTMSRHASVFIIESFLYNKTMSGKKRADPCLFACRGGGSGLKKHPPALPQNPTTTARALGLQTPTSRTRLLPLCMLVSILRAPAPANTS